MAEQNILKRFKKNLGEYCAVNQFAEVAKETLLDEHAKDLKTRDGIIELASKYSIGLKEFEIEPIVNNLSKIYIVNVHLCFETYLKDLYNFIKLYGEKNIVKKAEEESWLQCVTKNVFGRSIPEGRTAEWKLCEYYRLVRNKTVHDLCEEKFEIGEFENLAAYEFDLSAKTRTLKAPNKYTEITYDDFMLYARYCLRVAICLFENTNLDYVKVVKNAPKEVVKGWKKELNNPKRLEESMLSYIKHLFKRNSEEMYDVSELMEVIKML